MTLQIPFLFRTQAATKDTDNNYQLAHFQIILWTPTLSITDRAKAGETLKPISDVACKAFDKNKTRMVKRRSRKMKTSLVYN